MSVISFTYLFGGYVQEGMLANVESWERRWAGRDNLSNAQKYIVRREVKLPTFQSYSHLKEPQLRVCPHQNGWLLCLCEIVWMIEVGRVFH